jgi:RimJ/RimL family protein N-acetyltransferase
MPLAYTTPRLEIHTLNLSDFQFIRELVNTPEWIKFIGERNVKSDEDAKIYIQKLLDHPAIHYWVVRLRETETRIGVVTLIKKQYLAHHDIGFAFLPRYGRSGYAREAVQEVLDQIAQSGGHTHILATTLKDNVSSIKLLEKLGLRFQEEIINENTPLAVYSVSIDGLLINSIVKKFFGIFSNKEGKIPEWDTLYSLCIPQCIIIKKNGHAEDVYSLDTFLTPRKELFTGGLLKDFEEYETFSETKIIGNIAQRFSFYQKEGYHNGTYFNGNGNKLFQFVKTQQGWKITAILWEDQIKN